MDMRTDSTAVPHAGLSEKPKEPGQVSVSGGPYCKVGGQQGSKHEKRVAISNRTTPVWQVRLHGPQRRSSLATAPLGPRWPPAVKVEAKPKTKQSERIPVIPRVTRTHG